MLENKHWPEYEIHKAPCVKTSISTLEFLQICSISCKESSRERTTREKPSFCNSRTPSRLCTDICVLA